MKAIIIGICLFTFGATWAQSTWYEIPVPTTYKLRAIDFVNSSVGYIVGDSTTILKTIDGGENWLELNHTGISTNSWSQDLVDVDFIDELVGFVTLRDDNYGVYKTVDGGFTWTPASNVNSNMCYKSCAFVNSENDYYVGGAGCFQSAQIEHYQSSVWNISTVNYETFNPGEYVVEMDFYEHPFYTAGLAALNGQYMLKSTDYGATWDTLPALLSQDRTFTSVMYSSADTVFAGYEGPPSLPGFGFLMSTDGGTNWANQSTNGFFYPAARDFAKAGNYDLYAGGVSINNMGYIFESTDGTNWTEVSVLKPINGMDSYGTDFTFAVGDSGYVIVNVPIESLGLAEGSTFNPVSVYPNPAQDIITIETDSKEPIAFNLVNTQGQILIENIEVSNERSLDISTLPAGIYYLKSTRDSITSVKRIVKI